MKLSNEHQLPPEIGVLVGELLTPDTLKKIPRVCTGWNTFFSSDLVWSQKLQQSGISPEGLRALHNKFPGNNNKQLFKLISNKHSLPAPLATDFSNQHPNWHVFHPDVTSTELRDLLNSFMIQKDQSKSEAERFNIFQRDFRRTGPEFYNSFQQCFAHKILRNNLIDGPTVFNDLEVSMSSFFDFCGADNKTLHKACSYLNQNEFQLYFLPTLFFSKLGTMFGTFADSTQLNFSVVKSGHDSIILIYDYKSKLVDPNNAEWIDYSGQTSPPDPDYCYHFMIEMNSQGLHLLDLRMAVGPGVVGNNDPSKVFMPNDTQFFISFIKDCIAESEEYNGENSLRFGT